MDYAEKMQRYVEALEEERRKILVFQRELPLCLELVTQAIEAYRKELSGTTTEYNTQVQSECSEQTSSEYGHVLEEFIPIKRTTTPTSHYPTIYNNNNNNNNNQNHVATYGNINNDRDNNNNNIEEQETPSSKQSESSNGTNRKEKFVKRKSEWLRLTTAQLWNHSSLDPHPDPPPSPLNTATATTTTSKEGVPRKAVVTEVKRSNATGGHAFQPFQREKGPMASKTTGNLCISNQQSLVSITEPSPSVGLPPSAASSSAETVGSGGGEGEGEGGGGSRREDQMKEGPRKQRRCWSPELHRRFLHALQQLGGSHVATPKQIRELMKVDGLTNDEVKSHLQKYRLHTRRPNTTIHNNGNPQTPQFVVVGGIWVPPPEYAAAAATTASGETATIAAANGIYAPVATAAVPPQPSAMPPTPVAQKPDQKQPLQVSSEGRGSHSEEGHVHPNSPASSSSTHTTTTSPVY